MSVASMAAEVTNAHAVPNTSASKPSLTSNPNPLNTPPATGAITVAQSPSGAVVTNTGRSTSATQSATAKLVNTWNGVRVPGNRA